MEINPIKAIRKELSDTVQHVKDLVKITKKNGILDALKYDYFVTRIRHYSDADFDRDQEKTRRMRVVPVARVHNETTGEDYVRVEKQPVTDAEYIAHWSGF